MYKHRSSLGAYSALSNAIFRQEGSLDVNGQWIPSSLGYRLNNPGNLNYAGQPGCHPTAMGNGSEAQCDTMDAGISATERQLALDASRGLTLSQRLSTWATGNQQAYIDNVSGWLGVDPNAPLSAVLAGGGGYASPGAGTDGAVTVPGYDATASDSTPSGLSTGAWLGIAAAAAVGLLWATG